MTNLENDSRGEIANAKFACGVSTICSVVLEIKSNRGAFILCFPVLEVLFTHSGKRDLATGPVILHSEP